MLSMGHEMLSLSVGHGHDSHEYESLVDKLDKQLLR